MSGIRVSSSVAAPPELVWSIVSDVTATSSWSSDVRACRWLDGATGPAVGARFAGSSDRGPLRRWSTTSTVTVCEPGSAFGYSVRSAGRPIAEWSWTLTAADGGCLLTHAWTDRRDWITRQGSWLISGVRDRRSYNETAMRAALAAVAAAAESKARG